MGLEEIPCRVEFLIVSSIILVMLEGYVYGFLSLRVYKFIS